MRIMQVARVVYTYCIPVPSVGSVMAIHYMTFEMTVDCEIFRVYMVFPIHCFSREADIVTGAK